MVCPVDSTKPGVEVTLRWKFRGSSVVPHGGSAHIVTDPIERDRVYEGIHEIEQGHDPERTGVAIVVYLDHVSGRDSNGRFAMRRDD